MSNTKNLASLAAVLDDGSSGQVLQSTGSGGVQFADSSGSGVTVHANQAAMLTDAASASEGTLHYETGTNKLYVKQTSGFYLLASITNVAPTIDSISENTGGAGANDLIADGTFTLTAGSNTVITINATEPNLETMSYSATVTSGTATDVFSSPSFPVTNQSSNVFTLTPVTSGTGGTVTIRFDVSDGANIKSESHSFEIAFVIADSHYTSLLMATDGSAGANSTITYDTGSTSDNSFTVNGDPYAGTFSPYRHGGYSTYLDGSGDDLTIADHTSFDFGTGDFTVETWFYLTADDGTYTICAQYSSGNNGGIWLGRYTNGFVFRQAGIADVVTASTPPSANEWHHLAVSRSSGSTRMFIDGTQVGSTVTSDTNNYSASAPISIGHDGDGTTDVQRLNGYLSDLRIIKGTGVYTSNFTPPTERLTTVSGTGYSTSLLTCHLPYIADGSSNNHSITINGDPETKPFGPYDYAEYSESDNGGSVYFDGNGDYLGVGSAIVPTAYDTDYTIEMWIYPTTTGSREDIFNQYAASASGRMAININTDATISFFQNGLSPAETKSSAISANNWYHLAVVNSSGTRSFYVNGILIGTATGTASMYSGNTEIGRLGDVGSNYFTGYITDVRVVNGTAVYSGAFTPPTGPLTATGGTYPSTTNVNTSITASNTSLLLSGTDAHVIDLSQGSNLELFGTAAAVTSASSPTPPNNTNISSQNSIFLDGNSDYAETAELELGNIWTVECWFYTTRNYSGSGHFDRIWSHGTALSSSVVMHLASTNGAPTYRINDTVKITSSSGINLNTWYHLALVSDGTSTDMYLDGTNVGTVSEAPTLSSRTFRIGTLDGTQGFFSGYIQDLRVSVGKARYTSNFTVPSAHLKG